MKYYATIYIDQILDFEGATTHAFLGLTKGKSPDELDKIDKELRDKKLKNADWKDFDKKWYETININEYNDGFWGFGTANGDLGIIGEAVGKVFEYNQYVVNPNKDKNIYDNAKLRSSNTFNPSNRCTLEISQEQYETLLQNIHKDYEKTIDIKPQDKEYKAGYRYDIMRNNCVHWVQKHLRLIGVEIFEQFDMPGSFMDIFDSIREVHSIFLQFQAIDSYLESVKGAKTFMRWVDNMVGNKYLMCSLNKEVNKIRKENLQCEVNDQEAVYVYWTHRKEKIKIYQRLQEILNTLISKTNKQLKGIFNLLYVSNNKGYMLSPPNYQAQAIDTLDLTIPANNFSVSEFYPFIFIPDDEMIARILYHEYDYAILSLNYTKDTMAFYYAFLEGREINKYWSEAFHIINKRQKMNADLRKEIIKTTPNQTIDCKVLESKGVDSINSTIYFMGIELTGGVESTSPYYPCYFGKLDSSNTHSTFNTQSTLGFNESKPIYQLINEVDSSYTESKADNTDSSNTLSTLHIFLNNSTLIILNYSLLDSSLNIKLECTSSESKAILEKEKAQRAKQKEKDSQTKDSKYSLSTALLHPILEDNELKCPHNGVVQLQSNKGKSITDKNIPFILESDLLYSHIIGCTNNIAGVPTPCTQVAVILPSARGLKKHNGDYPIMQDLVSFGVFSDTGFPLICTPKPNSYKINAPNPTHTKNIDKEALKAHIEFHKPILRLHYKEHKSQQDNLPITQFYLFDNLKEQTSPFENLILDYQSDAQSMSDKDLEKELLQSYPNKKYQHKQINLQFGVHQIHLVFIIPQSLPKLFKEHYKNYEYKDYGIGKYIQLLHYSKLFKEYKESTHSKDTSLQISITHTRVFLAPFKANKLHFTFALGLDNYLNEDNTTELKIVIGGVYDGESKEETKEEKQTILQTSSNGKNLLKNIESLSLKPYDDQNGEEINSYIKGATIGYGHLISLNEWDLYKNGITSEEADNLFSNDLSPFENAVNNSININLEQTQFDALVMLCFNIGIDGFKNSSVVKIINGEQTSYKTLEDAWKAWNKSQGNVMQGLINRRNAEYKLYNQGIYERW